MTDFTESVVEDADLGWVAALAYAVLHGPEIAPGKMHAERQDFREAVLDHRLGETFRTAQPGAAPRGAGRRLLRAEVCMKPGLVRT